MIKSVIFDYGAVLIDWNPHHLYDRYFGSAEKAEWFLQNICVSSWNLQMDAGKPFEQGVRELTALHPEWAKEIEIYHTRWIEMVAGEVKGSAELVSKLKRAGYGVYGLTNWSCETFSLVRDDFPALKELDGMVVSGEEGVVKPDARIFQILFERYNLKPEESVFIDDNAANVAGSEAVGMAAIRFESAEQAERELRERFGIEL